MNPRETDRGAVAAACVPIALAIVSACGSARSENLKDPIPEVPRQQQRTVDRSEFRWQWPFTVGTGTLGCVEGAIVFRSAGTNYALNAAARSRGLTSNESIRQIGASGPPSNPLRRLTQDNRERIFAESLACERTPGETVTTDGCKRRLQEIRRVSAEELTQIEAEGHERSWAPLQPRPLALDAVLEAGSKLCSKNP